MNTEKILRKLGIQSNNAGACTGPGQWIEDETGGRLASRNPATGELLAEVGLAGPASYEAIVSRAREAFLNWRLVPAPKRGQLVRDIGQVLRDLQEPLGDLISLEVGKIRAEGHGEIQEIIDIADYATGLSRQLFGVTTHSERPGHRMYEQWLPLGPTGVITSFNFPMAVWGWNAMIGAVCGDTIVWKPSSSAPLCAVALQHAANTVMADHNASGIFNLIVSPGSVAGQLMLDDPRLPLISFTGSTAMGRRVSERVARRFGTSILELGGNNAVIVTANADLDLAVQAILFAAAGTAGQRCTSARRVLAHQSVAGELARRLAAAYQQIPVGLPSEPGTLMGPLINAAAVDAMMAAIGRAQAEGGEILAGGHRLPGLGPAFAAPTIVRMPRQSAVVEEETFAPLLYLMEYGSLDEALALHNAVPQGLSSAIISANLHEVETFLSAAGSDCGIANVNMGTSGAEIGLAFGGEKETGGGRESGSDAWKSYMRRQSVTVNWSCRLPLAQGLVFGNDDSRQCE